MNAKAQHIFKGVDIFFPQSTGASFRFLRDFFAQHKNADISRRNDRLEKNTHVSHRNESKISKELHVHLRRRSCFSAGKSKKTIARLKL